MNLFQLLLPLELLSSSLSTDLSHTNLATILKVPQALTTFIYRLPDDFLFHLATLAKALLPLQDTLGNLVLDFRRVDPADELDEDDDAIGSPQNRYRLEILDIPFSFLPGRGLTGPQDQDQDLQLRALLPP